MVVHLPEGISVHPCLIEKLRPATSTNNIGKDAGSTRERGDVLSCEFHLLLAQRLQV